MKLRWKVKVNNFGAGVGLKADPVLQFQNEAEDAVSEWHDVLVVEIEEGEEEDE